MKNWIFTKEKLGDEHKKKFDKLRLCIARAVVQEQVKVRSNSDNQRALVAYYTRKYLASAESGNKGAEKEALTPLLEQMYINHYVALILRTWEEISWKVKVRALDE